MLLVLITTNNINFIREYSIAAIKKAYKASNAGSIRFNIIDVVDVVNTIVFKTKAKTLKVRNNIYIILKG